MDTPKTHSRTDEKIALYSEWMKGDHLFVHVDSRREGVLVPGHLSDSANLKLKLSYGFQGETKHDEEAISVYLRFNGDYKLCVIPWNAIWGFSNCEGETCLWTEELPQELAHLAQLPRVDPSKSLQIAAATKPAKAEKESAKKSPPQAPNLSVVGNSTARKKPELRRVK